MTKVIEFFVRTQSRSVVARGADETVVSIKEGDRVVLPFKIACGYCFSGGFASFLDGAAISGTTGLVNR